jgi:hypothetical protein
LSGTIEVLNYFQMVKESAMQDTWYTQENPNLWTSIVSYVQNLLKI